MSSPSPETPAGGANLGGCWIAYYEDRSALAVFDDEVEALRLAVKCSMRVKFQAWGEVDI